MSKYNLREMDKINAEWIVERIKEYAELAMPKTSIDVYLEQRCHFVTIKFNCKKLIELRQKNNVTGPRYEFEAARMIFRSVCQQLDVFTGQMGPRPRPLAIFATDYSGSKFGAYKNFGMTDIHLHSIWCSRPDDSSFTPAALQSFRTQYEARKRHVQRVHITSSDNSERSAESAAAYLLKAWTKDTLNPSGWSDILIMDSYDAGFSLNKGIPRNLNSRAEIRRLSRAASVVDERFEWEM